MFGVCSVLFLVGALGMCFYQFSHWLAPIDRISMWQVGCLFMAAYWGRCWLGLFCPKAPFVLLAFGGHGAMVPIG